MNSFISISKKKSTKDSTKATQLGDIPGGIIKGNNFVFSEFLSHMFKFYIGNNASIKIITNKLVYYCIIESF